MREQQFIRLVEEICYLLKLSQPCSKTALHYFLNFQQYQGHKFDHQILIAACIYLSTKIFQQQIRLRDILNIIYVLTACYKLANNQADQEKQEKEQEVRRQHQEMSKIQNEYENKMERQQQNVNSQGKQKEKMIVHDDSQLQVNPKVTQQHSQQQQPFITLKPIQKHPQLHELIQPHYTLSDYNQYKSKIIQAEQTLLRILGFNFSLSEINKNHLKQLLITIHYLHLPPTIADLIIKIYNDLHYINVQYSLQGIVYFAYLIAKNMAKSIQTIGQNNHKSHSEKQLHQIERLNQFLHRINSPKQWELLLNTQLKTLQNYAEKLTNFYLNIQ